MKLHTQIIFKTMACAAMSFLMMNCATLENEIAKMPNMCDNEQYFCVENEIGIVISPTRTRPEFLSVIDDAKIRYEQFFAPHTYKTAIVLGAAISAQERENLTRNNFKAILPWLDGDNRRVILTDNIRKQIRAQSENLPEPAVEAMIEKALAQFPKGKMQSPEISNSALAHELAHLWYMEAYWPLEGKNNENHYGSAAPDWLDEMAAVLVEYEEMNKGRNKTLREIVNKKDGLSGLWSLKEYFTMEHPLAKKTQVLNAMRTDEMKAGGIGIMVLSGADAEKFLETNMPQSPLNFYVQSRGFADFMREATHDNAIFETITKAIRSGATMESWLAQHGRNHNLPTHIESLQRDWETWLNAKFAD